MNTGLSDKIGLNRGLSDKISFERNISLNTGLSAFINVGKLLEDVGKVLERCWKILGDVVEMFKFKD